MKLTLTPGFVLFVLALYLVAGELTWVVLLAAAVHELSHLLLIWAAGSRAEALTLRFADAQISTPPLSYGQQIASALAGPVVNLLLFWLFRASRTEFAAINLLLGVYNLLPIPALDGGRALGAALNLLLPETAARRISTALGVLTCAGLIAAGIFAMVRLEAGVWPVGMAVGLCLRFVRLQSREEPLRPQTA